MSAAETFLSCVLWLVVAFCLDHVHQDFHCIHLLKSHAAFQECNIWDISQSPGGPFLARQHTSAACHIAFLFNFFTICKNHELVFKPTSLLLMMHCLLNDLSFDDRRSTNNITDRCRLSLTCICAYGS